MPRNVAGVRRRRLEDDAPQPFLSACYIAKNEAEFIGRSIASLKGVADEVLVGDTGSTDDTRRIAAELGARVFHVPWTDDFAAARNAVLERARGKWCFVIDADEWFSPEEGQRFLEMLRQVDRVPQYHGVSVYQTNLVTLDGNEVLDRGRTVRAWRNFPYHRYSQPIHEQIVPSLRGAVYLSDVELLHVGFASEVVARKGKSDRNFRLLRKYLDSLPPDAPNRLYLQMQLGREYQRLTQPEAAADTFAAVADEIVKRGEAGPISKVIYAYLCSVIYPLGRYQEILDWSDRMQSVVPLPSADLPFYRGASLIQLGRVREGIPHLLEAIACYEGAPAGQELQSVDQQVRVYALASLAFRMVGDLPQSWYILRRGMERHPDRALLAERFLQLVKEMPPVDVQRMVAEIPAGSHSGIARIALLSRAHDVCLAVALAGRAAGDLTPAVWAAAAALFMGHPDKAVAIVGDLPADHKYAMVARSVCAMGARLAGDTVRFAELVEAEPDSTIRIALRMWGGLPINDGEADEGVKGLQRLGSLIPLPTQPGAAASTEAGPAA